MRLTSDSFEHGRALGAEFAMGTPVGFGGNRSPHLAWAEAPAGTRSFVLLCIDSDAPTDPALVNAPGVEIPVDHPRGDFVHWVMVDIPAAVQALPAGSCGEGISQGGKARPPGPPGARQGLNDYTGWFAGDPAMAGAYRGYDGPYPPANDLRLHRYFFRLFALDVERLAVDGDFTASAVFGAMTGHVLAETATFATYTLHPAVAG